MAATNLQFAHLNDADALIGLSSDVVSFTLAGGNVLVSGVAGKKIYVYGLTIVFGSATTVIFKDGPTTNLTGTMTMTASGAMVFDPINICRWQTSAGKDFICTTGSNSIAGGTIYYVQK